MAVGAAGAAEVAGAVEVAVAVGAAGAPDRLSLLSISYFCVGNTWTVEVREVIKSDTVAYFESCAIKGIINIPKLGDGAWMSFEVFKCEEVSVRVCYQQHEATINCDINIPRGQRCL